MKAEILKNHIGDNVRVSFISEDEVLTQTNEGLKFVIQKCIRTIEGNVFLHESQEMILQNDGTVTCFNNKNLEIKLEVL
ncbi:hypothetical protein PQE74_gp008 [Bacillus phage vB_BanS_Chewbecca]|uniref:Uncharacterized protein n=1 Tax=Bacillus phage vB_BanS_Chewbecca TaxID=2894786 RepID=A0AAE8YNV2_9CAUD|nr:hypothetical protein PQE74_gp008 [Bacillus phage vB_BanS_Chewbecca]UGO46091.1 hypothetical protein CHEWBECCA_8 [Bacillus phage vB_BanS_Chewbecca]